jgi:hypothetical protein
VPDRRHYDGPLIFIEDHAPIPNAETHPVATLESLHVTVPIRREFGQPSVNPTPHIWRESCPLTRAGGSEGNWLHAEISHIAIFSSSNPSAPTRAICYGRIALAVIVGMPILDGVLRQR